jgi:hypothetical protein
VTSDQPSIRLYGIRHHGPGSARAVLSGLRRQPPDVVLLEAPLDAESVLALAAHPEMRAPVALLGYDTGSPERAVFSPFAVFSPEWVALRWALDHDVPVRCIDLPTRHVLARSSPDQRALVAADGAALRPLDPLAELASAAGYDDAEQWWEDVVEHQFDGDPFEAIAEAMTELRQARFVAVDSFDEQREAHMRARIRAASADGFSDMVVVCGAWHVPALVGALDRRLARADTATLRGMPKVKASITWVPWTHRRLASATGYGAGVTAPGWYHHLFVHGGRESVARWFAESARVLRRADHPVSAADVVDATRLADALAAVRGRPNAGLAEVDDAARAVFGRGGDAPMRLISSELVIGTQLGQVPTSTPMVPLARNLAAEQKRCRLRPEAAARHLELDLRQPLHLERSQLLHRLLVLGLPWGRPGEGRRSVGTFRETWQLRWEPEFEVRLIEASGLGTTVVLACTAAVRSRASATTSIGALSTLLEECLLAGLDDAAGDVLRLIGTRSSLSDDVMRLMEAVPALARTARYGDVRSTDAEVLRRVLDGLIARAAAGLAPACTALDDEVAKVMAASIRDVQSAVSLLGDPGHTRIWRTALHDLAGRHRVHGLVQGLTTRVLADAGELDLDEVSRRVSRALSHGTPPGEAAMFVEGFLGGTGAVLVHDPLLLGVVDDWLAGLGSDAFVEALPLLRRTFGAFEPAERRALGERVRTGSVPTAHRGVIELDPERVDAVLATVGLLLGVDT